jgi:SAM-dependent methyltransferase
MVEIQYNKLEEIGLKDIQFNEIKDNGEKILINASIPFIKKLLENESKDKKLLDAGSGPGNHSWIFKQLGFNTTCLDFKKPLYNIPHYHPEEQVKELFDILWSHHCLEHIYDPIRVLASWRKFLKPSATFYLTVPHMDNTISSGHIIRYNIPMMIYHLAIAGYDCSNVYYARQGNHLRVIVKNSKSPDYSCKNRSLSDLAKKGYFNQDITKEIKETGRFTTKSIKI